MDLTEIGSRIKAYRKSIGLSQEKLAEMIFVSPHYIYEIERGSKSMSLETLIDLSKALKLSTDYILFGDCADETESLYGQMEKLNETQRKRAENAFKLLLPYIK